VTDIFTDFISTELDSLALKKLLRVLKTSDNDVEFINVSTNDYLGLSKNIEIAKAGFEAALLYGSGGQSSRLVTGNHLIIEELEYALQEWLRYERCLCYSSGFQLNHSVLKALGSNNTIFFIDKLAHNSLITGALDSEAVVKRFRHNDINHLEDLLKKDKYLNSSSNKIKWIIAESIYSMDGDEAPLIELSDLAKKYDCELYIDEAHAIGITGEKGRGLSEKIKPTVFIGTFGKAFGTNGAFIASNKKVIDFLITRANGFIYSTAISPFLAGASLKSLELMQNMDTERSQLICYANSLRKTLNLETHSTRSCIVPWIIGGEQETMDVSTILKQARITAIAIRPPTVPIGTSRIRFSLSASLEKQDLKRVVNFIKTCLQ